MRERRAGADECQAVIVWASGIADPETSGKHTVKVLTTEETTAPDGAWRRRRVVLRPVNPDFNPVVLESTSEDDVRVIAEVVEVLGDQR